MSKDELIVKQQLEIEELKVKANETRQAIDDSLNTLCHAEQWSMKCRDFPQVAMKAIVKTRNALSDTLEAQYD